MIKHVQLFSRKINFLDKMKSNGIFVSFNIICNILKSIAGSSILKMIRN